VVQHRLQAEYGATVALDPLPYQLARWLESDEPLRLERFEARNSTCLLDVEGRPLALFDRDWGLRTAEQENPKVRFVAAVQPGRSSRSAA
jgi:peptide chain release factor 3